jgi:gamma-glutamylcyclotransferase (GGCT)/AIG2-like uncharacterized protein YtfP
VSGDRFFVYGTLRPGRAPGEVAQAVRTLRVVARARLRGRLYDCGTHPGAIADGAAPGWIVGEVVECTADSPPLAWFDAYEECVPAAPETGTFRRERHWVETGAGPVECWVYVLVREPPAAPCIASGEWRGAP